MDLVELLTATAAHGASDLHLSSGVPPIWRMHGDIVAAVPEMRLGPLPADIVEALVRSVLDSEQQVRFDKDKELDFALAVEGVGRFRGNVYQQIRGLAAVFRVIPKEVPDFDQLGLPPILKHLALLKGGLVLVTGPTGSGKSTTLAAMVDQYNRNRSGHVITIEDPVEFVHPSRRSLVNQREVGTHTHGFANALRAALREDPDVLLVGELRDLETIGLAMTAAETGHLVFATLHTNGAAKTVDRVVNVFPEGEQKQIQTMLAGSLAGVVSQTLLPRASGSGVVAAHEILVCTPAVRALIREGKVHQLINAMQTGRRSGMQSMEQSLTSLVMRGFVTKEVADEHLISAGHRQAPDGGAATGLSDGAAGSLTRPANERKRSDQRPVYRPRR